jgi:hypothetical protein
MKSKFNKQSEATLHSVVFVIYLLQYSTLKLDTAGSSETLIIFYGNIRCQISEDSSHLFTAIRTSNLDS